VPVMTVRRLLKCGDAAGELPDRLHFLRLSQLCFEAEALGHVRGERKPRLFSIEDERMGGDFRFDEFAVFLRWREMPEFPDPGTRRARLSRNAGRSRARRYPERQERILRANIRSGGRGLD